MAEEQDGYDQVNTMFTPEGRLRQVEYASKTAKQGSPVIGITCKDGIVIITHRLQNDPTRVYRIEQKIGTIDEHIMVGISGIISDGKALIENAQVQSQSHRMSYGIPIDIKTIVLNMSQTLQSYTQFSGMRPFGVSMLIVGVDEKGPGLYLTEPSGTFYGYKATALGEKDEELRDILRDKYKDGISVDEAIALSNNALKKTLGKAFDTNIVEGFYFQIGNKKFKPIVKGKKV